MRHGQASHWGNCVQPEPAVSKEDLGTERVLYTYIHTYLYTYLYMHLFKFVGNSVDANVYAYNACNSLCLMCICIVIYLFIVFSNLWYFSLCMVEKLFRLISYNSCTFFQIWHASVYPCLPPPPSCGHTDNRYYRGVNINTIRKGWKRIL